MWLVARLLGSPATSHMVAVGFAFLPFAAALFVRWARQRIAVTPAALRHRACTRARACTVELAVENRTHAATPFLLLEDRLPAALGRPARLVLTGDPGPRTCSACTTRSCRRRAGVTGSARLRRHLRSRSRSPRLRLEFDERDELIVTPEVEDLERALDSPLAPTSGVVAARNLFRTGEEFYTMREYQQGDDLPPDPLAERRADAAS